MEKMIKNWRYWLLMAIGFAAFINLIGTPNENNPYYWELVICSKFTAVALAVFDIGLYTWFADRGEIDDVLDYGKEE